MHVFYPTPDVHFIEGDETLCETFIEEPIYNPFSLNENERTSPVIKYQGDVKHEKIGNTHNSRKR